MMLYKQVLYVAILITALYVGTQISNENSLQNNKKYIIQNDIHSNGQREPADDKIFESFGENGFSAQHIANEKLKVNIEDETKNIQKNVKKNLVHGIGNAGKTPRKTRAENIENYYNQYTYDDPASYKGPIIESWPPSKNRLIAPYMNEPFTTIPWRQNFENKTLLVIVQSIPSGTILRSIWRNTWAKYTNTQTSVLFLLGRLPDINPETETQILEEKNQYGDIIEVNGLIENYNNLTFKSLYTLKFFLDHGSIPSGAPQYVLKVDTDSVVILPKLYDQLTRKYTNITTLMLGRCYCCGGESDIHCKRIRPITKTIVVKRKNSYLARLVKHSRRRRKIKIRPEDHPYKKWEIPRYIYNGDSYPSYLAGPGYLLSRSAAECIYKMALNTPLFPMEDIFITGFLAQQCNIKRRDHTGFTSEYKFDFDADILSHRNCGSSGLMKKTKKTCKREIMTIANEYARLLRMGLIKS